MLINNVLLRSGSELTYSFGQATQTGITWSGQAKKPEYGTHYALVSGEYSDQIYMFLRAGLDGTWEDDMYVIENAQWQEFASPPGEDSFSGNVRDIWVDAVGNFSTFTGYALTAAIGFAPESMASGFTQSSYTIQEGDLNGGLPGALFKIHDSHGADLEDGSALTYSYTQVAGPLAEIIKVDAYTHIWLPEVAQDTLFEFTAAVTDSDGNQSSKNFSVTLRDNGSPPIVDAGADAVSAEGGFYSLAGSVNAGGAYDVSWSVNSGPSGAYIAQTANPLQPNLYVPLVDGDANNIVVELFALDNSTGRAATDRVTITVSNTDGSQPQPQDTTPPVVTVSNTTAKSKGKTYYTVSMAADEPAVIYFKMNGDIALTGAGTAPVASTTEPGWYEYQGAFELLYSGGAAGTIEYWARDAAGNASAAQQYGL